MQALKKNENLIAFLLIIFFFFPWVSFGGIFNVSGFQIPDIITKLYSFFSGMSGQAPTPNPRLYFSYLVYLIPLSCVMILVRGANNKDARPWCVVAGLAPFAILLYSLATNGANTFRHMAVGAWLTLGGAIAMLLCVAGVLKLNKES